MQFMDRWFDGFGSYAFARRVFDLSKLLFLIYFIVLFSAFSIAIMLLSLAASQLHPNGQLAALVTLSGLSMPVVVRHMVLFFRAYFDLLKGVFTCVISMFGWVADTSDHASNRKAVRAQRLKD